MQNKIELTPAQMAGYYALVAAGLFLVGMAWIGATSVDAWRAVMGKRDA